MYVMETVFPLSWSTIYTYFLLIKKIYQKDKGNFCFSSWNQGLPFLLFTNSKPVKIQNSKANNEKEHKQATASSVGIVA